MNGREPQDDIKIIVACHKSDPAIRSDKIYMPVQVGKALHPDINLGFQCDNEGENISDKNGSYCELTALYWAWKNLNPDVKFIGLAHYRRYLQISETDIRKFAANRVIVPFPLSRHTNIFSDMAKWTSLEDMKLLLDVVLKLYPDARKAVIDYYFNNNRMYDCNMFVMNRDDFNDYCSFIFSILAGYEKQKRDYPFIRQNRVIGYLAESLMGLWIIYRHKKVKTVSRHAFTAVRKIRDRIGRLQIDLGFRLATSGHKFNSVAVPESVIIN